MKVAQSVRTDICAVIISSDGYSDFWPIFFECWQKNSPFANMQIYLITATKTFSFPGLKVINTPDLAYSPWSDRIRAGLLQIPHKYIVLMTEDLLYIAAAKIGLVDKVSDFLENNSPTCLRLTPAPPPQGELVQSGIKRIADWEMHRVSLQTTVWDRNRLVELIVSGETPWEFEINGTKRSRKDFAYYGLSENDLPILEVIGRGKITRRGLKFIKKQGMQDYISREIFGHYDELKRDFAHLKSKLFYWLPVALKRQLLQRGIVGGRFIGS
jgi:hypothetical protein